MLNFDMAMLGGVPNCWRMALVDSEEEEAV